MVIDTSALMAVFLGEPEEAAFRRAIRTAASCLLGAPARVEAGIVTLGRLGDAGLAQLEALIGRLDLQIAPLSDEQATIAIDAFRRFGKGRHPAGLNYGDCFSYALAKATGEPLLFKGGDFALTDVKRVV